MKFCVARIKNSWLRRTLLCSTIPVALIAIIVLSIAEEMCEGYEVFKTAWEGQGTW